MLGPVWRPGAQVPHPLGWDGEMGDPWGRGGREHSKPGSEGPGKARPSGAAWPCAASPAFAPCQETACHVLPHGLADRSLAAPKVSGRLLASGSNFRSNAFEGRALSGSALLAMGWWRWALDPRAPGRMLNASYERQSANCKTSIAACPSLIAAPRSC